MNLIQSIRRLSQQSSGWKDSFTSQSAQSVLIEKLYQKSGLEIKMTCDACPEQYEIFKDGKQVAYYRLRHGEFRVDYPDCGGETIYEAEPKGDGIFEHEERVIYLAAALRSLKKRIAKDIEIG